MRKIGTIKVLDQLPPGFLAVKVLDGDIGVDDRVFGDPVERVIRLADNCCLIETEAPLGGGSEVWVMR